MLPTAGLPENVVGEMQNALEELKQAGDAEEPDEGRLRKGLGVLKRAVAPAAEKLLSMAVDRTVDKLLGQA
jgi:hypothetical protein